MDGDLADAVPAQDLREAWFDADDANLYATIRSAEVPEVPLADTPIEYELSWGQSHRTATARAVLDADGKWSFSFGNVVVDGEVVLGSHGMVRITVPRSLLWTAEGKLLRVASAHSYLVTPLLGRVETDRAAAGSEPGFGFGHDFVLQPCEH